ncbi:TPA: hypothetical protein RUS85_003675 [Citrobacter amalonaticus]|nr:hypothetical protein [Citrobacter amalonaticus]
MPNYKVGTEEPKVIIDAGSGEWCSAGRFSDKLFHYKQYIDKALSGNVVLSHRFPDAYKNLMHYFGNTGEDLRLDMVELINKSEQLRKYYNSELMCARKFCETLPASSEPYNIVSSTIEKGNFADENNANLYYAIGGYQYWGKGVVTVTNVGGEENSVSDLGGQLKTTIKSQGGCIT